MTTVNYGGRYPDTLWSLVSTLASMCAIQFAIATTNHLLFQALTRHLPRRATARQFSRSYPSPTVAPNLGPSSPITDDEVS